MGITTASAQGERPLELENSDTDFQQCESDSQNTERYEVVLFYKYCTLTDREKFRCHQERFCVAHNLTGRVRVAEDGINGCLSGQTSATRLYRAAFQGLCFDGEPYLAGTFEGGAGKKTFDCLDWKLAPCEKHELMSGLMIKLFKEVVSLFGTCYGKR